MLQVDGVCAIAVVLHLATFDRQLALVTALRVHLESKSALAEGWNKYV